MKAGVFSCDNGLGHVRRAVIIANELSHFLNVFLIGDKKKIKKFHLRKLIKIKNFNLNFSSEKRYLKKGNIFKKLKKNNFKKYDIIYTDNLPEFFYNGKKNFIFANFLWHKELNLYDKKYKTIEKFLKDKKIILFGNYLFGKNYLKNFNFVKVPFFGKYIKNKSANSILLSFGTAKFNSSYKVKKKIIKTIKNLKSTNKIFIEPSFYNKSLKKFNVHKADFTNEMYSQISVAYIKPGMGTVEECLKRGIPIISFSKNTSKEFKHNSKIINKNNLGISENNLERGLKKALNILNNKSHQKFFERGFKKLRWNGEKKVVKTILSNLNT